MVERIDILASKYFFDELEKAESNELMEMLRNPEHKERLEWYRKNWEGGQAGMDVEFDVKRGKNITAELIQKVEPGFAFPESEENDLSSPGLLKRSSRKWLRIAASLAIIAASAIALNTLLNRTEDTEIPQRYSEISTELGQLSDVVLPDGSTVFLNSSSRFIRPDEFSENDRVVQLSGEAYFEIAPDSDRPFIIHSNQVVTEVLGTKFNIKAYPEEDLLSVSVVEGTVRISKKNFKSAACIVLGAGDEYVLNHRTMEEDVQCFSEDKVLGWREGKFVFESSPLQRVLPMLSRKFDVEFVLVNENLNNCKLTAEFQNESLETILSVISFANDIDYEFIGRKIILNGPGCSR